MLSLTQPVRLDKLSAHQTPRGMLPTGYYLKGYLLDQPTIGHTLLVGRYERAAQTPEETTPVMCAGIYSSTPITAFETHDDGTVTVRTQNSEWRITQIDEEPERGVGLDTV